MSPRQKQSTSLVMHFISLLFFVAIMYIIISWITSNKMTCGCNHDCNGMNISCPCYRRRNMRNEYYSPTERYTPQQGTDFTSYLDKVRENQMAFQRESVKEGLYGRTLNQNQYNQLNAVRNKMKSTGQTNPLSLYLNNKVNKKK